MAEVLQKFVADLAANPAESVKTTLLILLTSIAARLLYKILNFYKWRQNFKNLPAKYSTKYIGWRFGGNTGQKNFIDFNTMKKFQPNEIYHMFEQLTNENWSKNIDDPDRGINTIWFAPHMPIVYLFTPETAKMVLESPKHIKKGALYDLVSEWIGRGLLTSDPKKWRGRRRLLTPTFHFKILQDFLEVMNQQTFIMSEKLLDTVNKGQGDSIDMYSYITLAALDIISETAMGTKINAQNDSESEYVKNIYLVNKEVLKRLRNPTLRADFMYKLLDGEKAKEYWSGVKMMQDFTRDIIEKRMKERRSQKEDGTLSTSGDGSKRRIAFLDLLLDSYDNNEIDFEGIREEVDTFMFEGHDTTSAALNMAFYELARNPRVRQKLNEEVDEIFRGDCTRDVTNDDLNKMTYVDAFIREVLRLYPSVPVHARELEAPLKINDKYTIPAGANIAVQTYFIHRDPKHWGDDASEFKPERYLDDSVKRHAYAWIPFAAGSRNCIGQRFAMMEMKMQVSSVVRRFEFEIAEGEDSGDPHLEMYGDMILRPWVNARLKVRQRTEFLSENS